MTTTRRVSLKAINPHPLKSIGISRGSLGSRGDLDRLVVDRIRRSVNVHMQIT
jgi:hypothetical protein